MFRRVAVRVGVLTAVFVAAVIFFGFLTNRGNMDMSADMGSATLPRVSFELDGYEINSLPGYTSEMVISSMRDTLTPVKDFKLTMNLHTYNADISGVSWEVYTLSGDQCLQSGEADGSEGTIEIQFNAVQVLDTERVLKVTLHVEDREVYYYTRIADEADTNCGTCLEFVENFYNSEMNKDEEGLISGVLESDASGDNSTYGHVTIHSDLEHVVWGELNPEVRGDVLWEIKECNENYTSVQLRYQAVCAGTEEDDVDTYDVKEFFRVRIVGEKQYLLDYDRTMDQKFAGQKQGLEVGGILLGVVSEEPEYQINSEGTIVAFVQDRALWHYDKEEDELSLVFSFADAENADIRNLYDHHDIRIISVDQEGNTAFTVTGYMNRGTHEGQTGVAVYYFDAQKNSVEEKAFVPSRKGYYVMKEELGRLVYYAAASEKLYVLSGGTFYLVDLAEDTRSVLVQGLDGQQYAISENGQFFACRSSAGLENDANRLTVLDMQSGESFEIVGGEGEALVPIGFIRGDLAYGVRRDSDTGVNTVGQTLQPMYQINIISQEQEIVKTYEVNEVYIQDAYINENMLTMNRVIKSGDTYVQTTADYITNNEEEKKSNISLSSSTDSVRGTVISISYADGISDTHPKVLNPKQVLFESPLTLEFDEFEMKGKYYVYALGKLQGVYTRAVDAVKNAETMRGVAVTSSQSCLWEQGNLPTIYEVDDMEAFSVMEGESSLAACLRYVLAHEGSEVDTASLLAAGDSPQKILEEYSGGEGLDLTGFTTEQVLYTISRETPVIALTGADHAVLLIGYNKTNVAYLDPADGQRHSVTWGEMEEMVSPYGNVFFSYTI